MATVYKMPYLIKGYLIVFIIYILWVHVLRKRTIKDIVLHFFPLLYLVYIIGVTLFPILIPPIGCREWTFTYNIAEILQYRNMGDIILYLQKNFFLFFPLSIIFRTFHFQKFSKLGYTIKFTLAFLVLIEILKGMKGMFGFSIVVEDVNINNIIWGIIGAISGWIIFTIYLKINKK